MMGVHLGDDALLPEPPNFDAADFARAEATGDTRPLLFEWYKWVGLVANRIACLDGFPPFFRQLPQLELAILRGLLNRCSRLMLAVLELASRRKHAEAIRPLSRAISESAIVLQWLCANGSGEPFKRYIAKGLDAELRLKSQIEQNIAQRGGGMQRIEDRMLSTISKLCELGEMSQEDVRRSKPLPDLASMLRALKHDELSYAVVQRQGSHSVHGTWPDLLFHYIEVEAGNFVLTDNTVEPEPGDFFGSAILVLDAIKSVVLFVLSDKEFTDDLKDVVDEAIAEIVRIDRLTSSSDFSAV